MRTCSLGFARKMEFFGVHRKDEGKGGYPSTFHGRQLVGLDAVVVSTCGQGEKMCCHWTDVTHVCMVEREHTFIQLEMVDR